MTSVPEVDSLTLAFAPHLPGPVAAICLIAAGLALVALAWATVSAGRFQPPRGGLWRLGGLALFGLALAQPSLIRERREPVKDVVAVVVDRSPSQSLGERTLRTDQALAGLRERAARFADLELRVVEVGGPGGGPQGGPQGGSAEGLGETRLFQAAERALADVPRRRVAGTVLITDGQVHDVPADMAVAARLGPVHALLTGTHDEADRRLTVVQAPSFGLLGKPVIVTVLIDDLPVAQAETVPLVLRRAGQSPLTFHVPRGRAFRLDLQLDHPGQNVFELEAAAAPRELTLANNRAVVVVNAVRDRLRVLLVSGEPHNGGRTWRNLLKSDPSVDLVHFTILRSIEKLDATPTRELSLIAFPIRELFETKLGEFDLIVFDRFRRRAILPTAYLNNIVRHVQRGGALLEVSGPDYHEPLSLFHSPLGELLPAEPLGPTFHHPFRPQVTAVGRRHPVTAGLAGPDPAHPVAWGRWLHQNDVGARRGVVAMTGLNERPLLILDRLGKGRVAQLTSDQVWLWSRGFEGGGPHAELLRRLAHWLLKEPELEENDLRVKVDGRRLLIERRSLEPETKPVTWTTPAGVTSSIMLAESGEGSAQALVTAAEPGVHRFSDGERTALAVVDAINPPEWADVRTTAERLAPLVAASGGAVVWLVDAAAQPGGGLDLRRVAPGRAAAGFGWLGLRANGDYVVSGQSETPLLPPWLATGLLLGMLFAGWRREGK
ncbi:Glutamine amidotransferase domain-containing protein [uncultured Gammaproteobacteria bacterium]